MVRRYKLIRELSLALFSYHNSTTPWTIFRDSSLKFMSWLWHKNWYILSFLRNGELEKAFFAMRSTSWIWMSIFVITNCHSIKVWAKIFTRHIKDPVITVFHIQFLSKLRGPSRWFVWPISLPFKFSPWISYFK